MTAVALTGNVGTPRLRPLPGQDRKTFARSEYSAFQPEADKGCCVYAGSSWAPTPIVLIAQREPALDGECLASKAPS
jgi:hypothetical protein